MIDFKINSLPIDVLKIARAMNIRVIKNSCVNDLLPDENGKAYFDGQTWIIIYRDENPTPVSRFTVAHELGHILLGHELAYIKYPKTMEFTKKPQSEQQADAFAIRLLCPASILWAQDLHSPEEIAAHCRIPLKQANIRAKRMKELYMKNKFLSDPTEQTLYEQFMPLQK